MQKSGLFVVALALLSLPVLTTQAGDDCSWHNYGAGGVGFRITGDIQCEGTTLQCLHSKLTNVSAIQFAPNGEVLFLSPGTCPAQVYPPQNVLFTIPSGATYSIPTSVLSMIENYFATSPDIQSYIASHMPAYGEGNSFSFTFDFGYPPGYGGPVCNDNSDGNTECDLGQVIANSQCELAIEYSPVFTGPCEKILQDILKQILSPQVIK